ncbi:DNA repair protein RadA [candidate division WOR-3 bacterium]|nr:DNA repair protein RadA [candidate division WOR-3 bacterium]
MKSKHIYVCQNCGYESPKWLGRCPNCGEWNTFVEEVRGGTKRNPSRVSVRVKALENIGIENKERIRTGIDEFDRVMGGGIVEGSVILIGGEPGIGKSTIILMISGILANKDLKILYVSGEESASQIKLRAERLNISSSNLFLLPETDLDVILNTVEENTPDILIVDSIQTTYASYIDSPTGSVSQVRECTSQIMRLAKVSNITTFIVGHITKSGAIAGPKTLEHMVDTVLYLEGDSNHMFRILRTAKNRFGSTNEIGIFEMVEEGLREVKNPSGYLIETRVKGASGSIIVPTIEGTRPFLVEAQSLVSTSRFAVPQRVSTGVDYKRLNMLIAITEKRLGIGIGGFDVFTNIVGGIKITEPGIDLGITLSLISSFLDRPIPSDTVAVGEVGLLGEVRAVNMLDKRVQEAEKMGFKRIIIPRQKVVNDLRIKIVKVKNLLEAKEELSL